MRNKYILIIALLSLLIMFAGCQKKDKIKAGNDKPVAKVYDKYLMMNELKKAIPDNLSAEDSAYEAENYINKWIKEQLLVHLAENYLTDEKKDIERKVEAFRRSLLIHTLKSKIIAEKLDTVIKPEQMRQYYEAHKQDFILTEPVVQGYLIKIPLEDQTTIDQVKQLVSYNLPGDIAKAQKLLKEKKYIFIDFRSQWKKFSEITTYLPFNIGHPTYFLQNKRLLETSDDKYFYYLRITDFILEGEPEPLELAQDQIKRILQNKEGERIFQDLENTLYTDGIKKGKIKLFY